MAYEKYSKGLLVSLIVASVAVVLGSCFVGKQSTEVVGMRGFVCPAYLLSSIALLCFFAALFLAHYRVVHYLPFREEERLRTSNVALLLVMCLPDAFLGKEALFALLPMQIINLYLFADSKPNQEASPYRATSIGFWCIIAALIWPPALLLLPISLINMLAGERSGQLKSMLALFCGVVATALCVTPFLVLCPEALLPQLSYFAEAFVPQPIWLGVHFGLPTHCFLIALLLCAVLTLLVRLGYSEPTKVITRHQIASQLRYLYLLPFALFYTQHMVGLFLLVLIPLSEVAVFSFRQFGKKLHLFFFFALLLLAITIQVISR